MALATLSIDLVAQLANLQQGMDKAGRLAEKQAAEIEARYARIADAGKAVGAALAGAISVAGLAAFFRATVNGLDALNDVKDATGATIENISALEDIAARTGTQFETVSGALLKFNKLLTEAKPGSEAANTLKAIGLSAEELKKIDPAEALRMVAVALDGYADNGAKARLVQDLFGKSTREVAAFLKDLAEQGQLNATVTAQQAEEAEKFNKQLFAFQKNATDAGRAVASELLPALNQLFAAISGKEAGGQSAISGLITVPLQAAAIVAGNVAFVLKGIGTEIGGIAAQAASLLKGDFKGVGAIRDMMKSDAKAARAEIDAYERRVMAIGTVAAAVPVAGVTKPNAPAPASKTEKPKVVAERDTIDESARALAAYVKQLQATIDRTDDLSERAKALDMLKSLGVTGEVPQVRELVLGLADAADERERGLAFAKAMTAEMEKQAAVQAGLDTDLARFSGRLDDARKIALTTRLEERLASGETFDQKELENMVKGIAGIKDQMVELDETAKNFAASVQNTLGDGIFNALSGNFDNIGKAWANMLLRMSADALAADITKSLFPGIKSAGGSALGSLWGAISGGIGAIFGGGRATGGGVNPGGIYEVVENGPELLQIGGRTMLLMGKQGGQVSPAGSGGGPGGSAGGVSVVQHITINGGVTRNDLMAGMQVAKSQAVAAVMDAQRRNFNGAMA